METTLSRNQLKALIEVGKTVNAHLDLSAVLESVMAVAAEVLEAEASSLVLRDEATGDLLFHVATGEKAEAIKPIRLKAGQGIVGWVVEKGEPLLINDVSKDPRFFQKVDEDSGFQTRAILCVPLLAGGRMLGAIEVLNKRGRSGFTDEDLQLLRAVAGQAAIAIENAMLHGKVIAAERLAAVGQTIAGSAHCIKNVLNGLQGGSYMVDLGLRKEESKRIAQGWRIVRKNLDFMRDLTMDMLTYAKERQPEYAWTNARELVAPICEMMSAKAGDSGVQMDWSAPRNGTEVEVDPQGIRRCLLNLVSNAVDACAGRAEGRVSVTAEVAGTRRFYIKIADNGCGIAPGDRESLFQVFFSTKGSKGTGLGLAVTRKIITEHGGTITVESEENRGTAFIIDLPRRRKAESSDPEPAAAAKV